MISKTLGLLVNTLCSNDKYSLINRDNLTQHIQMQLSKREKAFCVFFSTFSKSILIFEHFQKRYDLHG